MDIKLHLLKGDFSVLQIEDISQVNFREDFLFLGKTDDELSLVCQTEYMPKNTLNAEHGWRTFKIDGQLDFSLVGILADISGILAHSGISIFAVSTFNTDYILIKKEKLEQTCRVLGEKYLILNQ